MTDDNNLRDSILQREWYLNLHKDQEQKAVAKLKKSNDEAARIYA